MEPGGRQIVVGQFVTDEKLAFSRWLRRESTPSEQLLWESLRGRKLGGYKFHRQQIVDGYIADFICVEAGLVIELDGPIHEQQVEYDRNRDLVLAERKLGVLRFNKERVISNLAAVLEEILASCQNSTG